MIFNGIVVALALCAGFFDVAAAQNGGNNNTTTVTQGGDAQAILNPANIQKGSASDGQGNSNGVKPGQAASATDAANFINFCTGKTLTNGAQVKGGSCNGIPMGDIPATTNMVSTILTNPVGGCIPANKDFDVTLQVANLNAGVFTNPTVTYYSAPQALKGGNIVGHVHVTIQDLGNNQTPNKALDASQFHFFKGIDDSGDGNGGLKAAVPGGLPAGNYRVCTMSSAANHQPVTMPVAQRGAQDDCVRFQTADNCAANGGNGNAGGNAGGTSTGTATSSAAAVATSAVNKAGNNQGNNQGNNGSQSGSQGGNQGGNQGVNQGGNQTSSAAANNGGGNGTGVAGRGQQSGQGRRRGQRQRYRYRFQNRAYVE